MNSRWLWLSWHAVVLRQRGQAMLLVLLFLTVLMLSLLVLFNTSQLTRDKMEVQNAADSVAYSAALLEARHLNFTAYTNRAMIANEVALAQTIGLATWLMKWGSTFISLGNVLNQMLMPIPIAGPVLAGIVKAVLTTVGQGIAKFSNLVGQFAGVYSKLVTGLNTFYGYSQLAFRFGTYETMLSISDDLIQKNAPGAKMGTVSEFVQFLNMFLFEQYNKGCKPADAMSKSATKEDRDTNRACMRQMAATVNDSRDLWSKNRSNYSLGKEFKLVFNTLFGPLGFGAKFGFFQEGGTTLRYIAGTGPAANREHFNWSSMDTNEFKLGLKLWIFSSSPISAELPFPMGFGTMQLAHTDKKDKKQYKLMDLFTGGTALGAAGWNAAYGDSWKNNPASSAMASPGKAFYPWGPNNTTQVQSYGDLSPFHTIDPDFLNASGQSWQFDWPGTIPPPYVVWVYMPEKNTRTSDNMGATSPAGNLQLENMAAGQSADDPVTLGPFGQKPGLQAISSGEIYYKRTDGLDEEPNAFSPYWGARLAQVDNMVLISAMFAQEPKLAWAFTGIQQSSYDLAGQVDNVKQSVTDEMTDMDGYAKDMIENAIKGIFGL
ncbi:MAG: hypothetical protein IPK30_11075 [Cellvibrionales bacterium]|nr:hypothetical protein [Cellvibrionales bacterium]